MDRHALRRRAARQARREVRDVALCLAALAIMLAHALSATALPHGVSFGKMVPSWIDAQGNRVFDEDPSDETFRALEEQMAKYRSPDYVPPITITHLRRMRPWPSVGPKLYDVLDQKVVGQFWTTTANITELDVARDAYIDTLNLTPEAAQSLKTTGTHTETVFRPWGILWYVTAGVVYPGGVILLTTICWRNHKRRKRDDQGRCDACGYDLTGITGPCPECGEPTP